MVAVSIGVPTWLSMPPVGEWKSPASSSALGATQWGSPAKWCRGDGSKLEAERICRAADIPADRSGADTGKHDTCAPRPDDAAIEAVETPQRKEVLYRAAPSYPHHLLAGKLTLGVHTPAVATSRGEHSSGTGVLSMSLESPPLDHRLTKRRVARPISRAGRRSSGQPPMPLSTAGPADLARASRMNPP